MKIRLFVFLISLLSLVCFSTQALATKMVPGTYRIEAVAYTGGSIVLGSSYGMEDTPYFYSYESSGDDVLWNFELQDDGCYTISSKLEGSYITFTGRYEGNYKYLEPTDYIDGEYSHWKVESTGSESLSIVNCAEPSHHFHVRNSGTVGSYAGDTDLGTASRFVLYTPDGKAVNGEVEKVNYISFLETMRFDGVPALYDKAGNRFLITISENQRGQKAYRPIINVELPDSLKLYIEGHTIKDGIKYETTEYDKGNELPLQLYSGNNIVQECGLVFTYLPIVTLTGNDFGPSNRPGTFRITSVDRDSTYHMQTHWRGNTSLWYPKKNYAVKLTDANGESISRKVLGMRDDNHWILDAMQIDVARMRNRVSTDLWNDYHVGPYYIQEAPKAKLGTSGHFVEMILNGKYNGLYCLTEKMDRKEFRITKTTEQTDSTDFAIHGLFYKATEWSTAAYFGGTAGEVLPDEPLDENFSWNGWFEIKYPDVEDGEVGTWGPLYSAIQFVSESGDRTFKTNVADYFDLPVLRDYWLLIELCKADDNKAKNILWAIRDMQESQKLTLGVWDLDGTWGRTWNGTTRNAESAFTQEGSGNRIFYRLATLNPNNWNENLAERYAELRSSGIFNVESIMERFETYAQLFQDSGADKRENSLWKNTQNVTPEWEEEMPYIRQWITDRFLQMDAQYGYDPIVGISTLCADASSLTAPIYYDLQGRQVSRLEKGHIYIYQGRKVLRE